MTKNKTYAVTGAEHGAWVDAKNKREAKKIFRRIYRHEKILYCNILSKLPTGYSI